MASINVNDYLTGAKTLSLDGKYLIAQTRDDGITGTWAGNYIYKVQKSGANYFVIEQKWDFDKLAWVDKDAPIIRYDGTTLFFATNTHIDPYNGSIGNYKTVTPDKVEHNIVLAFLAFIADEFANANYDIFLTHENFIDDNLISKVTPSSSTTVAPTTVAPTTVKSTTVAPTTVKTTTVASTTVKP